MYVFLSRSVLMLGSIVLMAVQVRAQQVSLSAYVLDQDTQKPLAYAHIFSCKSSLGTYSNEAGYFKINLPASLLQDSLCISIIGYQSKKLLPSDLLNHQDQDIYLKSNHINLDEIIISNEKIPEANKVMRKALQRISRNYANSPYLMEGYYRDFLENQGEYQNLLEAAIGIYDGGFQSSDELSRVKVYQSRNRKGLPPNYGELYENNLGGRSGNINIVGGNTLSVLMYNNPVRNFNRSSDLVTGYELNESFIRNHFLEIQGISYQDGEKIYEISAQANQFHPSFYQLNDLYGNATSYQMSGKLFIRARDLGIMRLEYEVLQKTDTLERVLNRIRLEYKEYEGSLFLNYVSFINYIRIREDLHYQDYNHRRELFINNIRTKDLPPPDSYFLFSRIRKIHHQKEMYDPSFWETYNMVLNRDWEK